MKFLLSIFLLMSLVACSGSKALNEADVAEAGEELAEDADEFAEDFSEDGEEGEVDETADTEDEESDDAISDEVAEDSLTEENSEAIDQSSEMNVAESTPMETSGEDGFHTVSNGETLMIIAFKIYGDYEKWRELARWNSNKLGSNHGISTGMRLKYEVPSQKFVWNPEGNPYLVRVGDTLGTISKDTYGSMNYWKNIWQNNKPLIKDPNRIFAGFTIFTPVIDGRQVANDEI